MWRAGLQGGLINGLWVIKTRNHKPEKLSQTQPNGETKTWWICAAANLKQDHLKLKVDILREDIYINISPRTHPGNNALPKQKPCDQRGGSN